MIIDGPPEIMAKDVTISKVWAARCRLCPWASEQYGTYEAANADRVEHLDLHRRARSAAAEILAREAS